MQFWRQPNEIRSDSREHEDGESEEPVSSLLVLWEHLPSTAMPLRACSSTVDGNGALLCSGNQRAHFGVLRSELIAQPCVYGALTFPNPANEPRRGVDRKDSALGYVLDNCVPCCERHNRAKNDTFTYDEWLTICADYNVQCGAARQGRKKMPRTYAPALPRRQAGLAGWLNRQPSQPASHIS